MTSFLQDICDLDQDSLRYFFKFHQKVCPESLGSSHVDQFLEILPHIPARDLRNHLKRLWLLTNKSLTKSWLKYISSQDLCIDLDEPGLFAGETRQAIHALETSGYYIFTKTLPLDLLASLVQLTQTSPLVPEMANQQVSAHDAVSRSEAVLGCMSSRFFYPNLITSDETIRLLACDPALLSIVRTYLGTRNYSLKVAGWLSVGRNDLSSAQLSSNAQVFHLDLDAFRFLKVFVYLSDVGPRQGPHVFVSGSSLPFQSPSTTLSVLSPSLRASDQAIEGLYGRDAVMTHCGRAGTVIIEDTSGFHKGSPLAPSCTRDLLSFVYETGRFLFK